MAERSTRFTLSLILPLLSGCVSSRDTQREQVLRRQQELRAELANATSASPGCEWAKEWAGSYACGGWGSIEVDLTPTGITYVQRSCGSVQYASYGRIESRTPGGLQIAPVMGGDYIKRVLFVRWEGDQYIIPEQAAYLLLERIEDKDPNVMRGLPKRTYRPTLQ